MLPVLALKKSAIKSEGFTGKCPPKKEGAPSDAPSSLSRGLSLEVVRKVVVEFIRQGLRLAIRAGPADDVHHRKENLSVGAVLVAVGLQLNDGLAGLVFRDVFAIDASECAQASQAALTASRELVCFPTSIEEAERD